MQTRYFFEMIMFFMLACAFQISILDWVTEFNLIRKLFNNVETADLAMQRGVLTE